MIKLLDLTTSCTNIIKVELVRKTGFLDVTNHSSEPLTLNKDEVIGIVDLRSIGYHKVKQDTVQHHLPHYYEFKSL